MSLRKPSQPQYAATDVRWKLPDGTVKQVGMVYMVLSHQAQCAWVRPEEEEVESTFLDCFGQAFYDCFGIPFQGYM